MEKFVGQKVLIVKKDKVEGVIKEIDQEESLLIIKTAADERIFGYVSIINDKVVFVDEKFKSISFHHLAGILNSLNTPDEFTCLWMEVPIIRQPRKGKKRLKV